MRKFSRVHHAPPPALAIYLVTRMLTRALFAAASLHVYKYKRFISIFRPVLLLFLSLLRVDDTMLYGCLRIYVTHAAG